MVYTSIYSITAVSKPQTHFRNISQSNDIDSPVIILETSTNKRIEHWAELDHSSDTAFTHQKNRSLMIWPYHRLQDGANYIVALRYLKTNKGAVIQPSEAFKALRDNETTNDPAIEFRRSRYDEYIFPKLESNGIDRSSLQLAWEFTVQSTKAQTNVMVAMRDDAFSRIKDGNVEYSIRRIEDSPYPNVARKVLGWMKTPWYLNTRLPEPNARIVRNEKDWFGTPQYQGLEEVEFEILIPQGSANGTIPNTEGRFVQYGHGLFGNFKEIQTGYLRQYADEYGYILGATDWLGLASQDVPAVIEMMTLNLTNFPMLPARCHQGMLNALYFMKLLTSPAFIADDIWKFENNSINVLAAPYKRNYYGNSNGGIMGTVYMSLSTDVTHGTAGVPGGPYALLLPRSVDFSALFDIIKTRYRSDTDRILMLSLFQLLWTALDPSGYVSHINQDLFPNTPMHSILFHYSLGDAQVTWLGAQQLGRAAGCYMYESQVPEYNESLYGFEFLDDSVTIDTKTEKDANKCLIQGWNYNEPQVPFYNKPPTGPDTHEFTRRQVDSQEANHRFWSEGIIYNACEGPCNGYPTEVPISDQEYIWKPYKIDAH